MAISETRPLHFGIEQPGALRDDLDPTGEFLQDLLAQLADLVEFTHDGKRVEVDGFVVRNLRTGRERAYSIFPRPAG